MKIPQYLLILLFLGLYATCTLDPSSFSQWSSQSSIVTDGTSSAPMAYCNKFNIDGFSGILVSFYDWGKESFDSSKAYLYLQSVPHEFSYPSTNYIQMHSFYVANNKKVFTKNPLSVTLVKEQTSEKRSVLTTIGHDLLEDINLSTEELLKNHYFLMEEVRGFHGISISVFDARNRPIKTSQILLPPFEANPNTFVSKNNDERLLLNIHPFAGIVQTTSNTKVFYDKGVDFCDESPFAVEVPPYEEIASQEFVNDDPADKLFEGISFSPNVKSK